MCAEPAGAEKTGNGVCFVRLSVYNAVTMLIRGLVASVYLRLYFFSFFERKLLDGKTGALFKLAFFSFFGRKFDN